MLARSTSGMWGLRKTNKNADYFMRALRFNASCETIFPSCVRFLTTYSPRKNWMRCSLSTHLVYRLNLTKTSRFSIERRSTLCREGYGTSARQIYGFLDGFRTVTALSRFLQTHSRTSNKRICMRVAALKLFISAINSISTNPSLFQETIRMPSFQIALSKTERAGGRFVLAVRRALQRALIEENKKHGITQSDIAREIGVHRSVINRELKGEKDITLGRVGEIARALNRRAVVSLMPIRPMQGGEPAAGFKFDPQPQDPQQRPVRTGATGKKVELEPV